MEKQLKQILKKIQLPKLHKKGDVMSCVMCMVLVILASQSRVFDFLIETNLGRMGLLGMVLIICYTNKVFGVASVLFLVLAFAVHNNSQEGMCGKKKKKEGMCGKKKEEEEEVEEEEEETEEETEGFAGFSKDDRLGKERTLQMGKQSDGKVIETGSVGGAKPHDNLESEYGSVY
jgi:hypothetical protein